MGDRAHLLSPEVTLRTRVQDIVGLIESEELTDVVLCAHSAGGMVATGVAAEIPHRIASLVYLDAIVAQPGESQLDVVGDVEGVPAAHRRAAAEQGDGWLVPPTHFSAAAFGVMDPDDGAWVERHLGPAPLVVFEEKHAGPRGYSLVGHRVYVRARRFAALSFGDRLLSRFRAEHGWTVHSLDVAHDMMITDPHLVLGVLESAWARSRERCSSLS